MTMIRNDGGLYYSHPHCSNEIRPRALNPVSQGPHFRYYWNGERIDAVEQYARLSLR